MNKIVSAMTLLCMAMPALAEPPPKLRAAIEKWAAPAPITRFEYSLVDLNRDEVPDVVVRVTDAAHCGNGGCRLLVFKGTAEGYERVGDSGFVAKPILVLKEVNFGWKSLAGVVGLGQGAGVRPIHYMGTEYRSNPVMRRHMELTSSNHGPVLNFEQAE
jgi:hypothetical protein